MASESPNPFQAPKGSRTSVSLVWSLTIVCAGIGGLSAQLWAESYLHWWGIRSIGAITVVFATYHAIAQTGQRLWLSVGLASALLVGLICLIWRYCVLQTEIIPSLFWAVMTQLLVSLWPFGFLLRTGVIQDVAKNEERAELLQIRDADLLHDKRCPACQTA